MTRAALVAAAALAATAAGCGGSEGSGGSGGGSEKYPAAVRKAFVENCTRTGGPKNICECSLDKLQAKLPFEEFKKEEAAIAGGAKPSQKLTDTVAECR